MTRIFRHADPNKDLDVEIADLLDMARLATVATERFASDLLEMQQMSGEDIVKQTQVARQATSYAVEKVARMAAAVWEATEAVRQ